MVYVQFTTMFGPEQGQIRQSALVPYYQLVSAPFKV